MEANTFFFHRNTQSIRSIEIHSTPILVLLRKVSPVRVASDYYLNAWVIMNAFLEMNKLFFEIVEVIALI